MPAFRHSDLPELLEQPWDDFLEDFSTKLWLPGQHIAAIAPTGAGKTTLMEGILKRRRYVLALDVKGGDSTLDAYGFQRLNVWPGQRAMARAVMNNDKEGRPSRYVLGGKNRTEAEEKALVKNLSSCLDDVWEMGGWTVYADELMLLTDRRMMALGQKVDRMLIAARDRGISFVSSYQAPSWVTPMAGKQSTWVFVSYTRDKQVVDRLAEILGRPAYEIRGAIKGLEQYCWLVVGRNPREPLRITKPDYVESTKKREPGQ